MRGKALSPTDALPTLSPPRFAAHALHCRAFGAASVRRAPAPADLNLSFRTDGSGARKRRSSAAALPQKRFDSARNHRRPRKSGTGRDRGSPPDLRLRSAGTFLPSPHKRACLRRLCPAQEQASRTPLFSLLLHHAPGIPAPKLPPRPQKPSSCSQPLTAASRPARSRPCRTSTRRRGAQHAAPLLLPPLLLRPFVPTSCRNLRPGVSYSPDDAGRSSGRRCSTDRTRPSSDNKKAPSG